MFTFGVLLGSVKESTAAETALAQQVSPSFGFVTGRSCFCQPKSQNMAHNVTSGSMKTKHIVSVGYLLVAVE